MLKPIFVISGSPAAGKTTLSLALMEHFPLGLYIPVDDLREWVVSGLADPIDWTEETERQFTLAEEAACDLACRYNDAGFAVAIDHCRSREPLDAVIDRRLAGRQMVKVALFCDLETNLARNQTRTNKSFPPEELIATIHELNPLFAGQYANSDWSVIDNVRLEDTIQKVLALAGAQRTDI